MRTTSARQPEDRPAREPPAGGRGAPTAATGWQAFAASPSAWIALAVLALVLRLPRLGESLWYDETYYSTREMFPTWEGLAASLDRSTSAPLYRIALHFWTGLFGEAEWVVRLPSLALGLVSIGLACALARARGGRGLALAVGVWLALAPVHVWYSQEATPYAMALCLALGAIVVGDRIADEATARRLAAFALLLLAAALTHFFVAALLGSFAVAALASPPRVRRRWLTAIVLVGVAFAMYLVYRRSAGVLRTSQGFLRPFGVFEAWMLFFQYFLDGNCLVPLSPYGAKAADLLRHPLLLVYQLLAAFVLARGVTRLLGRSERRLGLPLVAHLIALPAAVGALGLIGLRELYLERYLLFALVPFAIVLLHGARGLAGDRSGRTVVALLLAGNVAAYAAWYREDHRWTVYKQNPDWRSTAAEIVAAGDDPADVVVLGVNYIDALAYHVRRLSPAATWRVYRWEAIRAGDILGPEVQRVDVVENLYWRGSLRRILRTLEEDFDLRLAETVNHRGVILRRYRRDPAVPEPRAR